MAPRLDLNLKNEAEALEKMKENVKSLSGINFALLMRQESGLRYYPRSHQPCQGGEMRKYEKTHGDLCTRPQDSRPGDLCHPFPSGIVEAVSIHHHQAKDEVLLDTIYGPESPYLRGFNDPETVIRLKKGGKTYGLVFTDMEVDPSVFVNSLQCCNSVNAPFFRKCLEIGLTPKESLITNMILTGSVGQGVINPGHTFTYYFSAKPSFRRLFESDPHDISGGLYRDGYDYNRKDIQDLFKRDIDSDPEVSPYNEFLSLYEEMYGVPAYTVNGYNHKWNVKPEQFYEVMKKMFDKYYYNVQPAESSKAA